MRYLICCFIFFSSIRLHAENVLRWGADTESGAPYSFYDPPGSENLIGFEVELVKLIAEKLGMQAQFVQNSWDGLIEGLRRGDYDIAINGIEITQERSEAVRFSIPYYISSEVLAVRNTSYTINSLADLTGKKVGTLDGSLAHKILNEQKNQFEILPYDEEILAYNDLALERLDAVLLDEPIFLYYGQPHPKLKRVGVSIGRMEYGIAIRKSDEALQLKINQILKKSIANGELRKIYERWGMWNELTARTWNQDPIATSKPVMYEYYLKMTGQIRDWRDTFSQYLSYLPVLLKGAVLTLKISVFSMVLAILIGLIASLMRLYGNPILAWAALAFVEVFRGTPLLIQLYLIFYGLPHIGLRLEPFTAAVIGLGLNYGACEAENYRAGILSVPKSQFDAALALGLSRWQALYHVIMPQAMRLVIPPVTNDFIALLKDSSLVSVITMVELTTIYGQLASSNFDYLGIGLLTAVLYFLIGLPFVRLSRYFERQLASGIKQEKSAISNRRRWTDVFHRGQKVTTN